MSLAKIDADVVVDARDCILGRVSSKVAQRVLDGETVAVVNAERAVITGNEEATMETYHTRAELGSDSGPYYPKRPDRIFKRAIRGMLPYKTEDGREALSNVRVYVGNPYERDEDAETVVLDGTSLDRLSNIKFTTLGDISESLGANVTW
ncbi:50S ribosomal protein L13 [Halorubrum lacusprofundi]|jgi:large subunit ribosomal protein L13|uniref:Large ribosomal subunit protein uL13 n=1 Tax=Halorubrum lacusprofundi (strain ATCC 49239 / DSM 5036 / JCM 8891 / ACAM 34) TaxID=416348 RepID=B9LPW2_HALLT|nr:50S ribosomal protein L13 [Halorubrum lacusprofundi]ACM57400.1 ribosomal protein L13 [Halorubrum lacusprofundi ATCC 49239]MCG1005999.1 50S ribosomal protein L13 [Halorubrum lacusprofundi]